MVIFPISTTDNLLYLLLMVLLFQNDEGYTTDSDSNTPDIVVLQSGHSAVDLQSTSHYSNF